MLSKYKYKTPFLLRLLYPECSWWIKSAEKEIFLTFDDGPIPDVTEFVLDVLWEYNCKATFFCVGENVYKHPEIYKRLLHEGHQVGNHTYNHLNGWLSSDNDYFENIRLCQEVMTDIVKDKDVKLFRPPYGKIKKSQSFEVRKSYKIIMWDLLTRDFDQKLHPLQCLNAAKKYTQKGSVVIFHDSLKASKNMRQVLSPYIESCLNQGFKFSVL